MSDRRSQPRFATRGLATSFGEVTNISDTGLCVFRKGKMDLDLDQQLILRISHELAEARVKARVARIERLGLFRHEIGLQFIEVDVATLAQIRRVTEAGCQEFSGPRCWVAA
ncbi:MAG: PilZ domain-containing protein [Planctomycetota bacterium]